MMEKIRMSRFKFRARMTPEIELDDKTKKQFCFYIDDIMVNSDGNAFVPLNSIGEGIDLPETSVIYQDLIEKIISDGDVINNEFLIISDYYCDVEQALQCDKNGNLIYENDVIADADNNRFLVDWSEKKNRFILTNGSGTVKAAKNLKKYVLVRNSIENYKILEDLNDQIEKKQREKENDSAKEVKQESDKPTITVNDVVSIKEVVYANDFKRLSSKLANDISRDLFFRMNDWNKYGKATFEIIDGLNEIHLIYKGELIGVMGEGYIEFHFDKFKSIPEEKENSDG